jgi:hypothetical protein
VYLSVLPVLNVPAVLSSAKPGKLFFIPTIILLAEDKNIRVRSRNYIYRSRFLEDPIYIFKII